MASSRAGTLSHAASASTSMSSWERASSSSGIREQACVRAGVTLAIRTGKAAVEDLAGVEAHGEHERRVVAGGALVERVGKQDAPGRAAGADALVVGDQQGADAVDR